MCNYKGSAILVSKNNYGLLYTLNKECKIHNINLITENTLDQLLFDLTHLKPRNLFIDESTITINNSFIEFFNNQENVNLPKLTIISKGCNFDINKEKFNCEVIKEEDIVNNKNLFASEKYELVEYSNNELNEVRIKIEKFLYDVGISSKLMGYMFLKDSLELILLNNALIYSLDSKIYPMIACKYKTEKHNIERNIRNAIEKAYKEFGDLNIYSSIRLDKNKNKLSNKQFLNFALVKLMDY